MEYVICIDNQDYPASLELRKIYPILPDAKASDCALRSAQGDRQMLRVIDESGEDYLYPDSYFLPLELSEPIKKTLAAII